MAKAADDIISQKIFLSKLKKTEFHLKCLEDSREAAHQEALEEYCDVGSLNDKIGAYRRLGSLDDIMDKTELAIEECTMLDLASQHVSQLQLEALRFGMISDRLNEENDWLSKENRLLEARIKQLLSKIAKADADMQQYLLMCQIRQTDTFKSESKIVGSSIERNLQINRNILPYLSAQFKAFYSLALQYINSGRFEVAISLCNQSRIGRKLTAADDALITYILALTSLRNRDSDAALKQFETACKLISSSQGKDNICLVPFLVGYGKAFRLAKKFEDSITQLQKAFTLKQAAKEIEDEEAWSIKVDIASNQIKLNKTKEASQLLFDLLNQATQVLGSHETVVILIKNYLARCYVQIGQSKEALNMVTEIIEEIFEHEDSPSIPSVLKNPESAQVSSGSELVSTCQQTTSMLELFTYQTLVMIYHSLENGTSVDILNQYIRMHGIDFEIE